ncbi:MAG: N-acetylmuramoyl-L-alanine amidase [Actinomycetota bacterium]
MATVAEGIYLEDNPPARSQFWVGRRDPVRSVIVVHTAESGTDTDGPDPKAENVASFIQGRSGAGSYHLIGDADSIIQLVRFDNEAFGDRTGSNAWAIHISLAMNAADWPTIPVARRVELINTAGQMAAIAARWLNEQGRPTPQARLLTRVESDQATASGFISHARRDPGRRTDPGDDFPWALFFDAYQHHLTDGGPPVTDTNPYAQQIKDWQLRLVDLGYAPDDQGAFPIDGWFGDRTLLYSEALADDHENTKVDPSTLGLVEIGGIALNLHKKLTAHQESAQ